MSASLAERVFEGSRNAMLIADDSRRYIEANSAACELLATPREELLELTIDDFTPDELRDRLVVSPETVRSHVKSLGEKLGARNRAHAVVLAVRTRQLDLHVP